MWRMSDDMGIVYRLTAVSVAAAVLMVLPVMLSLRTLRKKEMGARILFGLCLMTILSGFLIFFPTALCTLPPLRGPGGLFSV